MSMLRDGFGPKIAVDVPVLFDEDAPWSLRDFAAMRDELSALVGRPVDAFGLTGRYSTAHRYAARGE